MKKYLLISIISGFILSLGSCSDYLDVEHYFKDRLSLDSVFSSRDYSDRWLAGVYSHLTGFNADVASKGYTPFNFISDDMFYGDRDEGYRRYKNGEYNEGSNQNSWGMCYEGIRDASTFIHNIDHNLEMNKVEIADKKAQARFLRAYYYWLLLRKYGPIPLLPDEGVDYTVDYESLARPRNTYDECADFITSELALAAKDLPEHRTNRDVARPTKGAALAARAKVYVYAASPLFNGNSDMADLVDNEGRKLISQEYSNEKWARAAAAAKDVIDMDIYHLFTAPFRAEDVSQNQAKTVIPPHNARYSDKSFPEGWKDIDPFESYRQLFNGALSYNDNPELIFSRGTNQDSEGIEQMVYHQMPRSMNAWNTHGITLKQHDAYFANDGSDIATEPRVSGFTNDDSESEFYYRKYLPLPANVSLQFANREPRFYASVAYNGCIWEGSSATLTSDRYRQVFIYRGYPDGIIPSAQAFHIRTGIGIKKYYNPIDNFLSGGYIQPKLEPAIRYAEVLLIYAEAMNELNGSYTIPDFTGQGMITVSRNTMEMSKYITQIRVRAGLPDFASEVYANADKFRKALKRERQVELFAEGHRYYDLRRWKDAEIEEATPVKGFNMNITESQRELFYLATPIPSMPTVFVKKMYLWPISHDELRKNSKLTQNPGWTHYYN